MKTQKDYCSLLIFHHSLKRFFTFSLTAILLGTLFSASAQDAELDSLLVALNQEKQDTNKLKLLELISDIAPEGEWQMYNERMGELAQKLIPDKNARVSWIGKKYYAMSIGNKAFDYAMKSDYIHALELYNTAIAMYRELGEFEYLAGNLTSLGSIYSRQGEYDMALDIFRQADVILAKSDNIKDYITNLVNIGSLHNSLNQADSALVYFQKALIVADDNNLSNYVVARLLHHLGSHSIRHNDIENAKGYFLRGLQMATMVGDLSGKSANSEGLAEVYLKRNDLDSALFYSNQAVSFAKEFDAPEDLRDAYAILKEVLKALGRYKEAVEALEFQIKYAEIVKNNENQKAIIRHKFQYDYDIKEATAKAEQEKKDGIARAELKRHKFQKTAYLLGFFVMLLFASVFFRQRINIGREKKRSDALLLNILPAEIAEELKQKGRAEARDFDMVSILFTDFKGFTEASAKLSAQDLVAEINSCFEAFDGIMAKYHIEKIKTIGDAYMAAGGLPVPTDGSVKNTVLAALEMQAFISKRKSENEAAEKPAFEMRVGIHTGPVVAGIVGVKKFQYDIWGDTVNTASRMESSGEVGRVNVSQATYKLLKDHPDFAFESRGKIEAKGKGEVEMYFVNKK